MNMSRSTRGTVEALCSKKPGSTGTISVGFGMAHLILRYKVEEADTWVRLANTRNSTPRNVAQDTAPGAQGPHQAHTPLPTLRTTQCRGIRTVPSAWMRDQSL